MAMDYPMQFLTLFCVLSIGIGSVASSSDIYIVHVELPAVSVLSSDVGDLEGWYRTFLPSELSASGDDDSSLVYSYHNVFKGFAARLTAEQVKEMGRIPGFVWARPQQILSLHTTHSPGFLGLNQNTGLWSDSDYGSGVIIGLLDTGVTPNHPSFADDGMPPPPARWRGRCETGFSGCNRKLIGARSFTSDGAEDRAGHGTHTSSTAAGSFVSGANVFGMANGTAAGVAPRAHIASYKTCSRMGCPESGILAAFDAAIDDGVDIISLSLGGPASASLHSEFIAVAAFRAVQRGIVVSAAAFNSGPSPGTVQNGAPWMLTVGASTVDRRIRATAVLGNSEELNGESTYQPADYPSADLPLVFPGLSSGNFSARYCDSVFGNGELQGRIVVCQNGRLARTAKGRNVRDGGAAAMILINELPQGDTTFSDSHVLPATHLSYADGQRVIAYLNSTSAPTARISFRGTVIGDRTAPAVASYSGRGPNRPSRGILKPDLIGPGHNILAAWYASVENNSNAVANFNIIGGTSMSCPHLSGAAALLKSAHPTWSPAAIKSALMTTADQVNLAGGRILDQTLTSANAFATGSGHVNILRATNPGLIYNIHPDDYLRYLCGLNYTDQQVGHIADRPVNCSGDVISSIPEAELNYPSFSVFTESDSQTYNRTVTNVGEANEVYTARFSPFETVEMTVEPSSLNFSAVNQSLSYRVTFTRQANFRSGAILQGSLTWTSSLHSVRSPVVIFV